MSRSPREVAEQVRRMVAGEGVDFADLFAMVASLEIILQVNGYPVTYGSGVAAAPPSPLSRVSASIALF